MIGRTILDNHYVGCLVIDGFDLLFCIGLFAGADAHLDGNPGKCSKGHTSQGTVRLELCPHCPNDKNTEMWQTIVSLFQDST